MGLERLRNAIVDFTRLADRGLPEAEMLAHGTRILDALLAVDDWLPVAHATPNVDRYQQYLLHCDPLERFSIVSFVWGPGQSTPVHDHRVWGLVGVLRGAERNVSFTRRPDGSLEATGEEIARPGDIAAVSPRIGDIHQVSNALADQASISIHVYGGNIGAIERAVFDPASGTGKKFISSYTDVMLPNVWAA